ncbi:YkgJ family cysteine cluster protein [Dyella jiangningensis]|uniref:YkgJ family cysteine cluster protein n=1 Tax=Dyella jiangningensis TaxID=1379159 RepID=UPI0024103C33|nr:YkgJ family cysteine cluster protein [Dyella jiangningensis]MDG2536405.1 YkgJ family cysteine cluster protein [Dyella jiangningensis]
MIDAAKSSGVGARCSSCEAVCCRLTVILQSEDRVPAYLTTRSPEGMQVMRHGEEGWCIALNTTHMNCGIYETRPSVCRHFVMNGPYCKAIRADYNDPVAASARYTQAI